MLTQYNRARCRLVLAALLLFEFVDHGWCQGLPPSSTFRGDLRRAPTGEITVVSPKPPSGRAAAPRVPSPPVPAGTTPSARQASPGSVDTYSIVNVVSNVANAPGWQPGHSYVGPTDGAVFGDRVIAGPAYVPVVGNCNGGTCTNGQPLYLWAAVNATAGISSNSGDGPKSCPTPGTSTATDGTVMWRCLAKLDYVTATSFFVDDPIAWAAGTPYYSSQFVTSNGNAYRMAQRITCTSGSMAPSGTGSPSDGNCVWTYMGSIPYTSGIARWPHQLYKRGSDGPPTIQLIHNLTGLFWHGGTAAPQYVGGSNEENAPITSNYHQAWIGDVNPLCSNGNRWEACGPGSFNQLYVPTLTAAPGEGICDRSNIPLNYDAMQGVAFYSASNPWSSFDLSDSGVVVNCLQFKSNHPSRGAIIGAENHNNDEVITNSIIDSAASCALVIDSDNYVANNLIVLRSHDVGAAAACSSYITVYNNNTIVGINTGLHSVCIVIVVNKQGLPKIMKGSPPINNNLCFGFSHTFAYSRQASDSFYYTAANTTNNATDAPNNDLGDQFNVAIWDWRVTGTNLSGFSDGGCGRTCYNLAMKNVFVDATNDFRLSASSPVRGAGAPFGPLAGGSWQDLLYTPNGYQNSIDFFGVARGPKFDIGAAQFVAPGGSRRRER